MLIPRSNKELTAHTKQKILDFFVIFFLISIGIISRFFPHPPNFTPIAAIALFGGVYFSRKIAFLLPIAIMVVSDIFIGYYGFSLMLSVYGSFSLLVILSFWLKKHKKWYTVLGSSLLAALVFFLLTNFAVWLFSPWYTKNIFGLIQCFLMALPFFRNTLLGNLFYISSLFGIYELAKFWIVKKDPSKICFRFKLK